MNLYQRFLFIRKIYAGLATSQKKLLKQKQISGDFKAEELLPELQTLSFFHKNIKNYFASSKANAQREKEKKAKTQTTFALTLILSAMFGFISWVFSVNILLYIFLSIFFLEFLTLIIWLSRRKIFRLLIKPYQIQIEQIDFLIPLLIILMRETHPKSLIKVDLNFNPNISSAQKLKVDKNYPFLFHNWIKWFFLLGTLLLLVWQIYYFLTFFIIFFVSVAGLFPFFAWGVIELMGLALGKTDKVKSIYYKTSKLALQAKLIDGTILRTNITQIIIKRRRIKKKIKIKNFRAAKTKWKYKIKTNVKLQLAFSQEKYQLSDETFRNNFSQNPTLVTKTFSLSKDKTKFKENAQKKIISYQYNVLRQGTGKIVDKFPQLRFKDFLSLIIRGGYNKIRETQENVSNISSETEEIDKNQTKQKLSIINGIGKRTAVKLNKIGFFSIEQVANLSKEEIDTISQGLGKNRAVIIQWKNQAKEMIALRK